MDIDWIMEWDCALLLVSQSPQGKENEHWLTLAFADDCRLVSDFGELQKTTFM